MRLLRTALAAALVTCVAPVLHAQRLGPPEPRPRLRDITDTNDANAYYTQGLDLFEKDPGAASAAFYWAARINPAWGDAIYARRASLIMRNQSLRKRIFERRRNDRRSEEMLGLDSLQFRALMANPFLYRRLDRPLFMSYFRDELTRSARISGEDPSTSVELDFQINQYLSRADMDTRAWVAYANGNFRRALDLYASALGDSRTRASTHLERARIFGMQNTVDSAVAEFDLALTDLRKQDQNDLVVLYDSKAQAEFSKAVLQEGAGNVAAARESYAQALQEDLAYYPAHVRMGLLALGQKDTTTAMSELALAAQAASSEPHVRYVNGFVMAVSGHNAEAASELKAAIELDPWYALPYLCLGEVEERLGKGPEALAAYEGFMARASSQDAQRPHVKERIADINEILSVTKP